MSSWLDIRRMRYLTAIHRHGSVSEAARKLRIAQPALSHHLREMEKELGSPLFVRSRHGVELTELGRELQFHADAILKVADEAQVAIKSFVSARDDEQQTIKIAIIPTLSGTLATKMIETASRQLPGYRLHLQELYARESRQLIELGQLDFAITLTADEGPPGDVIANEELFYVYSPVGTPVIDEPMSMRYLAEQPIVLPSRNSVLRDFLDRASLQRGFRLQVAMEIDGWLPRKDAVVAGLAGTILPMAAIAQEIIAGTLVARSLTPRLVRPIVLEYRNGVDQSIADKIKEIIWQIMSASDYFVMA